jgi:hypothetical protein
MLLATTHDDGDGCLALHCCSHPAGAVLYNQLTGILPQQWGQIESKPGRLIVWSSDHLAVFHSHPAGACHAIS